MISLGKTLLLTSALTLTCTFANAVQKNNTFFDKKFAHKNSYKLFIPNIYSEGKSSLQLEVKKIAYSQEHHYLPKVSSKEVIYKSCRAKKKNELYELSAIFNDKLQMFLSYIEGTKNFDIAEKQNNSNDLNVNSTIRIN